MTEQKIEAKIVSKFTQLFSTLGLTGVDVRGFWQSGLLKGLEDGTKKALVVVKLFPRSYSTPMVPTCQIEGKVVMTLKTERDSSGTLFLSMSDAIMGQMETWQKCLEDTHDDFSVTNEFSATGFTLGNGNAMIVEGETVYTYEHNFTVYGIIENTTN